MYIYVFIYICSLCVLQARVFSSGRSAAGVTPSAEDHERAGAVAAGGRAAAQSDPSESRHCVHVHRI